MFLCRALFASFLSRYTLTSIVPTNDQFMSCPLSSQVERVIHTIPCIKQSKICKRCPTQVTWKVKFKCQFCLSCLPCHESLSNEGRYCSVCPNYPPLSCLTCLWFFSLELPNVSPNDLFFTRPLLQKGSSLQEEILSVCLSVCLFVCP